MDIIEAIFLGIVQGLTEFFPVSSSGHLVLAKDILGIEQSILFDVMMHVATVVSIIIVFRKEIAALLKPPFKKLALLVIASVPAAVAGYFLNGLIEDHLIGGLFLPFMFLITAALLTVTEIVSKKRKKACRPLGIKSALIMGFAQSIAIIPGISRSGATISAGVLSGAEREKTARFSFFMSIPIILGSAAYSLIKGGGIPDDISILPLVAGMIAAAITGFFAINLMFKLIVKSNYKWFAIYLGVLFAASLIYYIVK